MSKYLLNRGSRTIFSTHYHELMREYVKEPNVVIYHMSVLEQVILQLCLFTFLFELLNWVLLLKNTYSWVSLSVHSQGFVISMYWASISISTKEWSGLDIVIRTLVTIKFVCIVNQ